MIAKLKSPYVDRLNRPYATGDDKKRKMAEAFEALNELVRRLGGAVTSPPGRYVRIECPRGSELPAELAKLGCAVMACGSTTRIVGADYVSPRTERLTHKVLSPFVECDVFEVTLSGK
jgi:hypothetical protein